MDGTVAGTVESSPPRAPEAGAVEAPAAPPRGGAVWFLAGLTSLHAINDLYGFVVPPLLPALQAAFRLNYLQLGLLAFATTAVSAVAQPLVGYWADVHRRRRLAMVAGFVLFPMAMVLVAAAPTYAALVAAATVLGLASCTYHPQGTTLLIERFQARRGWASGIHGVGNSIGFALAPLLVGPLAARFGWRAAAAAMALPSLAAAAAVWRLVREPAVRAARGLRAGVTRPLLLLTLVNGIELAVVAGFVTFLPAYYAGRGAGLALAGLLTAPTLAAGLVAQPLGGALSDRFGRRELFVAGLVGVGLCVLAFPFAGGPTGAGADGAIAVGSGGVQPPPGGGVGAWGVQPPPGGGLGAPALLALGLLAGFFGSVTPPISLVYAAELAPGGRTGQAVGLAWGAGIAISSVAAPLTGALIDHFGFPAAYSALGALALLAAVVALRLPGRR